MSSPHERLLALVAEHGLLLEHPQPVMDEVRGLSASPGIDDPSLLDLRELPFTTIDGAGTRDLDQALHVARRGKGFVVWYALADAAHFVRPGTALFAEALLRGASYYLPGLSVPMLPRMLSEGLISLNPGVDRRAMVFEITLEADGTASESKIHRARVHSRQQLDFDRVLQLLDGVPGHGIDDRDVQRSLRALEQLGELRLHAPVRRDAIAHRAAELSVKVGDDPMRFIAIERMRNRVERYNEQLSLLCNTEGAALLERHAISGAVQPIYRIHDPPEEDRLEELAARIEAVAADRGLPRTLVWDRRRESLAEFLRGLPQAPELAPVREALYRQAIMVNAQSQFSAEPGAHFGIGAEVYARFSAPMREIVGVFVHKEMWEILGLVVPIDPQADRALQAEVIAAANRSRRLQRELTHAANRLVIDELLGPDLARAPDERPRRPGTVMGLSRDKMYVKLDEPPVDVKLYCADLDPPAHADGIGARLMQGERVLARLGDRVNLVVAGRHSASKGREDSCKRDRFVLELASGRDEGLR